MVVCNQIWQNKAKFDSNFSGKKSVPSSAGRAFARSHVWRPGMPLTRIVSEMMIEVAALRRVN